MIFSWTPRLAVRSVHPCSFGKLYNVIVFRILCAMKRYVIHDLHRSWNLPGSWKGMEKRVKLPKTAVIAKSDYLAM